MDRALLLVAGRIGRAAALPFSGLRRPLGKQIAALQERLDKLRAENDLLRARRPSEKK